MQLTVHPYILPLADPFRIAHESRTEQPTLIVSLTTRSGLAEVTGYGEAAMTRYYGLDQAECLARLEALAPAFAPLNALPDGMEAFLNEIVPDLHPFLRCALDVAYLDLESRRAGVPLHHYWGGDAGQKQTPTCYTIGHAPLEEMVRKLTAKPWPIYKIKVGAGGDDLAIVRELRRHTDAPFYVDANTGWTAEQTISLSHELKALGVVFIEQPLPPGDPGQAHVYAKSALPIIADESCQTEADVDRCAALFHGINIKIVKCGGLTPARRMIARARELHLQVMAGCMTESSVGISAIAQLLPWLDYADMDGAMLLAEDPARGVTFDPTSGGAVWPDVPGTGVRLL